MNKPISPPSISGSDLFVSRTVWFGYYYGFSVHEDLIKEQPVAETYRKEVMQVNAETFWKSSNELLEKVMEKEWINHKFCIVPAQFCAMCRVNDASCLQADITLKTETLNKPKECGVQFLQSRTSSLPEYFSSYRIITVYALCNNALREQLLLHYGIRYKFSGCNRT